MKDATTLVKYILLGYIITSIAFFIGLRFTDIEWQLKECKLKAEISYNAYCVIYDDMTGLFKLGLHLKEALKKDSTEG